MARVLTEKLLKDWISQGKNIEYADISCAEGIKYDFRLGTKFLKSHFGRMVDFDELSSDEKRHAVIKPGEVVYVLTQERLNLPSNIFVQLSPKRKLSHVGIQLLGGLTIDPGYEGYMVFGLCNLSSTDFTLEPGKKLVGAVFYELSENEVVEYKVPDSIDDFPEEAVAIIKQYKPIESLFLSEEITRISTEVSRIIRTLESDNEWKSTFKANLNSVSEKLTDISTSLQVEIQVRKDGENVLRLNDEKLTTAVAGIGKSMTTIKIWARIIAAILAFAATVAGGIVIARIVG